MMPAVLVCLSLLLTVASASKDPDVVCGSCRVVVDELDYSVRHEDLNKTLLSGSFRIDPNGNSLAKKVPYSRSDTQLTHLLETVCNSMVHYGAGTDNATGRPVFIRTESRDGKPLDIGKIKTGEEVTRPLKMTCETLVEDYHDEIKEIFMKNQTNPEERVCVELAHLCTDEQLKLNFHAPVIKEFENPEPEEGEKEEKKEEEEKKEVKEEKKEEEEKKEVKEEKKEEEEKKEVKEEKKEEEEKKEVKEEKKEEEVKADEKTEL